MPAARSSSSSRLVSSQHLSDIGQELLRRATARRDRLGRLDETQTNRSRRDGEKTSDLEGICEPRAGDAVPGDVEGIR